MAIGVSFLVDWQVWEDGGESSVTRQSGGAGGQQQGLGAHNESLDGIDHGCE